MADERFLKTERLRKRAEFLAVQERGQKGHAGHFLVFVGPSPGGPDSPPRLGVTVTKKIGGAVVRNRIKRLVREVFRREKDAFPAGMDVVVVARQGSAGLGLAEVREDLLRYMKRLASARGRQPSRTAPPLAERGAGGLAEGQEVDR